MLHATMLPATDTRMTTSTPTTPTPTPTPTTTTTPIKTLFTSREALFTTKMPVMTSPFSCVSNVCTASGQVGFTFQTLQSLINMANKKLGNAAIAVDGKIDARTVTAFMPVSRAVGGTLAIFDQAATPNLIATNADAYARGIALWLQMTWVEATPDVPGHWERLRVGQTTVNLPTVPAAPAPRPDSVMQPMTPTEPTKPPVMVMYVCPDGTRVSNMAACPAKPVAPPTPTTPAPAAATPAPSAPAPSADIPAPGMMTTSGRYSGCVARFNRTRKVFAIYCPVGSTGAQPGLGIADQEYFRCLRGNCVGLGADTVTPPPPAGMVKAAEVTTLPGAGEQSAGEERDKFWRLGNPLMWAVIAGAATVVGGGSFVLYRRKHRSA